jgi:hypothetical protein
VTLVERRPLYRHGLTEEEQRLLLAGLCELRITYLEDDDTRQKAKALALKLQGDPDAMLFGAGAGPNEP